MGVIPWPRKRGNNNETPQEERRRQPGPQPCDIHGSSLTIYLGEHPQKHGIPTWLLSDKQPVRNLLGLHQQVYPGQETGLQDKPLPTGKQ